MSWNYNLRQLFLTDPCDFSGVYDGLSYVWGVKNIEPVRTRRGKVMQLLNSEELVQAALVKMLLVNVPIPLRASSIEKLAEQPRFVMSDRTIQKFFREPYMKECVRPGLRFPKRLTERVKLLERPVYLHDHIPLGLILSCGYPESVGVISTPRHFPYPVGIGRYATADVKALRVSEYL